MDAKQSTDSLYYIKPTMGHIVYLKDDTGRRVKTTFSKFYEGFDPTKEINIQEIFELTPIDPKYEKRMDERELRIALEKEQRFDPYQIELL